MKASEPHSDRLSGFRCPWDIVQILTWLFYFVASGWTFYLAGSEKAGLEQSDIPLFIKIVMTLFTCSVTVVCTVTDPSDELFYLDWNGHDSLTGNKYMCFD